MSKSIRKCSHGSALLEGSCAWVGALVAVLSASCADEVVVGDALGDAQDIVAPCDDCGPEDGGEPEDAGEPEGPDCTDADAEARAEYDAWKSTPNSLAELAGMTFSGYIEGGADLTLFVGRDQSATLVVGEPADPPVKDTAYLCGDGDSLDTCSTLYSSGLLEGGTYPLHGASFEDGRFIAEVEQGAAVDAWCALQDPVLAEPDCLYSLVGPEPISWGANGCWIGSRSVDCGWFAMANDVQPCRCTSTECFGGIGRTEEFTIDLRQTPEEGSLEGSLVVRETPWTVYLSPSTD